MKEPVPANTILWFFTKLYIIRNLALSLIDICGNKKIKYIRCVDDFCHRFVAINSVSAIEVLGNLLP